MHSITFLKTNWTTCVLCVEPLFSPLQAAIWYIYKTTTEHFLGKPTIISSQKIVQNMYNNGLI